MFTIRKPHAEKQISGDNDFDCLKDETYYLGEDFDELAYDIACEVAVKLRGNEFLHQCEQSMIEDMKKNQQIKSKERVKKRGEVFTAEREVNAMLDLVENECVRPESRFLEPACGTGNFLVAILERKLKAIRKFVERDIDEYVRLSEIAVASLYGVDIMRDNVFECRSRLYATYSKDFLDYLDYANPRRRVRDILSIIPAIIQKNIIVGNMLTGMCVDDDGNDTEEPIKFAEWEIEDGVIIKYTEFTLEELINEDNK